MARGNRSERRENSSDQVGYERTQLVVDVVSALEWALTEQGITRGEFARRMGVSPGRATQILSGNENLTLATLAAAALAVDGQFKVHLALAENVQTAGEGTNAPPVIPVDLVATDPVVRRQARHRHVHKPGARSPSSVSSLGGVSAAALRRSPMSMRILAMFSLSRFRRSTTASSSPS